MAKRSRQRGPGTHAQEAFQRRMEQQCCQIQRYRQAAMRNEGRYLSPDEAAMEWIETFAADFACEGKPGSVPRGCK